MSSRSRLAALALPAIAAAQVVRVIPFSEAVPFRMGRVTSNRIIHPEMGAKNLTLNYSITGPGDEFAQHVHDASDDTIIVLAGRGDLRQGDSRRTFHAGEVAWVPAGQIHGTITTAPDTHMISFQTPPDWVLYTGARDSSRPGAAPPSGAITPGAVKFLDASRSGVFAHPGIGASRIIAWRRVLKPGERFETDVPGEAEQAIFVWKGPVTVEQAGRGTPVPERSGIFVRGPVRAAVKNDGAAEAVLIQAQAPPPESTALTGRWAAHVPGGRVFFLEIGGGPAPSGWFFGATGGRLAEVLDATVRDGELRFRVERVFSPQRRVDALTTARLRGDRLEGVTRIDGREHRWTGWRSIELADRDDGSWRDQDPVPLLDEKLSRFERAGGWEYKDGVLRNTSPKADLLSTKERFWNFRVAAEYRLERGGNSGIGLRNHFEVQLFDDHGEPPDIHGNASIYSRVRPAVNAGRPAGEWQSIAVTLIGRTATVILNGLTVIDRREVGGLSGIALTPFEDRPGPVSLQGDHGPVEFRKVVVTPLKKR